MKSFLVGLGVAVVAALLTAGAFALIFMAIMKFLEFIDERF